MTNPVTVEELNSLQCYDFSIQTLPNGKSFLILICKKKEGSNRLIELLHQNPFDLKIYIDESSGNYSLVFEFINSDITFKFETGTTEIDYPPLKKLKDKNIKFITTGIWVGESPQGRACEYSERLLKLGKNNIGDSFKQAEKVQFVLGELKNEPPVIMLIYKDYNHIFEAEADEAYNNLLKLTNGNPTIEISPKSNLLNLKIWDILVDLEIEFTGLNYSQEELEKFIEGTNPNNSFAFVLGFPATGNERAAIASTKREGFEIVTLKGYSYNK